MHADAQWSLDHLRYDVDLSGCTTLREVLLALQVAGVRGRAELVRYVTAYHDEIPCLKGIKDLDYRVDRACGLLGIQ